MEETDAEVRGDDEVFRQPQGQGICLSTLSWLKGSGYQWLVRESEERIRQYINNITGELLRKCDFSCYVLSHNSLPVTGRNYASGFSAGCFHNLVFIGSIGGTVDSADSHRSGSNVFDFPLNWRFSYLLISASKCSTSKICIREYSVL